GGSALTGGIAVEDDPDDTRSAEELLELDAVEIRSTTTGGMGESGLPQRGDIEAAFGEEDLGSTMEATPAVQPTLGVAQEAVRCLAVETAAIQVVSEGEDDAVEERVAALRRNETGLADHFGAVAERLQVS